MGDEDDGLLRVGGKEAGKEIALGGLVERAANLIEQEDVATMQQTTGYGNALSLSFAESPTPFTEFGAECIGQIEHEIGTGDMQHMAQFIVGSVGLSQQQIIADGATHKGIALWYETDVATHRDTALCGLHEAEHESEQRGLANARLAHDSGLGARLEVVGEVREDFSVARGVTERYVVEVNGCA